MENSSSQNYVRIENSKFGNRGIICTTLAFIISFILCVVIGATGPQVLQSRSDGLSVLEVNESGDAVWNGSINDMVQLNQLFWLSVKVGRSAHLDDEIGVIETLIDVTGYDGRIGSSEDVIVFERHDKHAVYCNSDTCSEYYIFGQSSIRYRSYAVSIRFADIDTKFIQSNGSFEVLVNLHTVNSEYSKFELGWKAFFCLTTLIVLFLPMEGYFVKLYSVPLNIWSFEQTWVLGLLTCLFFFNDPFFAAQLYTEYTDGMAILYIFLTCTFIAVLLIFWLSVLDEMRTSALMADTTSSSSLLPYSFGRDERNMLWFYGPKLMLVCSIWGILISTFVYIRMDRKGDPTYEGLDDWVLRNVEVALVVLLAAYIFWLFMLLVLTYSKIVELSSPFKFLFGVTAFLYGIVFTGLFAGYFYPLSSSAVVFLCFYASINFYVWTLAFAFAPLSTDEGYMKATTKYTVFGEDYFDEGSGDVDSGMVMKVM